MKRLSKLFRISRNCPLRTFGIIVGGFGFVLFLNELLPSIPDILSGEDSWTELLSYISYSFLVSLFIFGPIVLSIFNILYLILPHNSETMCKRSQRMELLTILFGGLCFYLVSGLSEICWGKNWWEQLYNSQLHAPVATWTYPTLITLCAIGIVGYFLLYFARMRPLPPLVTVLGLGCLYVGAGFFLTLLIQLIKNDWICCVYLGNLLLIIAKVIKELLLQYNEPIPCQKPGLQWIYRILHGGKNLPWLGLVAAIPVLGIGLAVLTLFGQEPDSIIQAWTQTSDWTFSQQTAPPNLPMDYHYLCTVAARGHQSLVKPLRLGKRHGHWVIVNRQLAVANAFEELLQERVPGFHRIVRNTYDRYGYPIANHIRSTWASDIVWLLMKPAEWLFLAVLYLFDLKPENRIAVQYPHKPVPTIESH